MAYTDEISFDRPLKIEDELIEWGLYGSRWTLTQQWTNISGNPQVYKENKYYTYIQNDKYPYCVIKRKGLYYVSLKNVIFREGSNVDATQVGHICISINEDGLAGVNNIGNFYDSGYFSWPGSNIYCMILQTEGFITLNVGDTVAAYVSRSIINNYNLYTDGLDYMQIVHICDRLED